MDNLVTEAIKRIEQESLLATQRQDLLDKIKLLSYRCINDAARHGLRIKDYSQGGK